MKIKSISPIFMFITSITLMILGLFMIFNPIYLESMIINIIYLLSIIIGVFSIVSYIFSKDKRILKHILSGCLCIIVGILIKTKIILIEQSLVFIIGIYAFINFIAEFINAIILYENKVKGRVKQLISSFISLSFSLILITHPLESIGLVSTISGIYLILYGLTVLNDFISEVFNTNNIKNNLKRRIRIRLPIIYSAFIPQKILESINSALEIEPKEIYVDSKSEETGELEVFIHLGKMCANGFGHVDICYKDIIYSYGTYDDSSDRLFDFVSDGVLIESNRDEYIKFNTKNRRLVSFVLSLNDDQCEAVEKKINKLKSKCNRWYCEAELNPNRTYEDYTNALYLATNAKFYKFKYGYFKTYFALTTNCVKLADVIIGAAGIDSISINGIITPGVYFKFFDKLFKMKNTIVIKRNIYPLIR